VRAGVVRPTPSIVTLTTDAGPIYAAQMRGVLLSAAPGVTVVDLDTGLPPLDVVHAAVAFRAMAERYPAGSVHLVIVDPGVGGPRAPIAMATKDGSFLVGPDNGVLDLLAQSLGRRACVRLDPDRCAAPGPRSPTFEGRDLFAPAAARLALGTPLEELGHQFVPRRLRLPRPRRHGGRLVGRILLVDRFGNLITNVPGDWAPPERTTVRVTLGEDAAPRSLARVRTYSDLEAGRLGVLVSSFDLVEIAAREGSASTRCGAKAGDRIEIVLAPVRATTARGRRRPPA
jgi:S-adenosylmethionine hydrolase